MALRWSKGKASSATCSRSANEFLAKHPVGFEQSACPKLAVAANVLVERHLLGPEPPSPPALPVLRLVDDDAVDPGAEGGLSAKAVDGPEDVQEHVLRQVERLVVIAQQVQGELVHHALVLVDELRVRIFVALSAALDQRRLVTRDIRPAERGGRLH